MRHRLDDRVEPRSHVGHHVAWPWLEALVWAWAGGKSPAVDEGRTDGIASLN